MESERTVSMFDLAGADPERRFSPYCWRTRLALAHKGLAVRTVPWRFTDKAALAFSNQGKVPVIVDGSTTVSDSWKIALYLEDSYGDRPGLFGSETARATTRFINDWADVTVLPMVARMVVLDVLQHLDEKDRAYFRDSREERFGKTLEEVVADREDRRTLFRDRTLAPVRRTLKAQPFLGGDTPRYADYTLFGVFQWARTTSDFPLLDGADAVAHWRTRMLDLFDGLARRAPGYGDG